MLPSEWDKIDSSYWDIPPRSIKQAPCVQDLFWSCDEALFSQIILEQYASLGNAGLSCPGKTKRKMQRKIISTLEQMKQIPIKPKRGKSSIFLPFESFEIRQSGDAVVRNVGAWLACERDLAEEGQVDIFHRTWAHESWESVLSKRVWLGGQNFQRDKYLVLGHVFWEMTYFGFEASEVEKRQSVSSFENTAVDSDDVFVPRTLSEAFQFQSLRYGLAQRNSNEEQSLRSLVQLVNRLNEESRKDAYAQFLHMATHEKKHTNA